MAGSQVKKDILELEKKLKKYCRPGKILKENDNVRKILENLGKYPVDLKILKETQIGITVNKLRKICNNEQIEALAKSLIKQWKKLVPGKKPSMEFGGNKCHGGASTSFKHVEVSDDPVRQKSIKLLVESLSSEESNGDVTQLAVKIESCIFEDFKDSGTKYKTRIRSRIVNLRDEKNPKLKENVLKGVIAPEQFACMTPDEMASDEVKKLKEEMLKQSILEAQVPKTNLSSSNLFKCSRCGERDTTYNQVQTLSGDEPMTTFVVCNKCGKRWKFN